MSVYAIGWEVRVTMGFSYNHNVDMRTTYGNPFHKNE